MVGGAVQLPNDDVSIGGVVGGGGSADGDGDGGGRRVTGGGGVEGGGVVCGSSRSWFLRLVPFRELARAMIATINNNKRIKTIAANDNTCRQRCTLATVVPCTGVWASDLSSSASMRRRRDRAFFFFFF